MIDLTNTPIDLDDKTPRILKVDGTQVPFPPKNGKFFVLEELQAALSGDGNNDPTITMAGKMSGMMMIAEDNAVRMKLPPNPDATWFYNAAAVAKGNPDPRWPIFGNCIIFPEAMMR